MSSIAARPLTEDIKREVKEEVKIKWRSSTRTIKEETTIGEDTGIGKETKIKKEVQDSKSAVIKSEDRKSIRRPITPESQADQRRLQRSANPSPSLGPTNDRLSREVDGLQIAIRQATLEIKREVNRSPRIKSEDDNEQGNDARKVKSETTDSNTPPSTPRKEPKRERTPISDAPVAPPPPQTPSKRVKKEDPENPSSKRVKKESDHDHDDAPNPLDWTVGSRSSPPPLYSAPASPSSPLADRLGQRAHQRQLALEEGNVGDEKLVFTSIADIWANTAEGSNPRFPQRGPPCKRFRCRQPSTFFVVSRHNGNGNALRPAYRCEPCSEFVTFADRRNVHSSNPRCACGQLSRMEQTGENAKAGPGKKFFVCMEGRCRFMEWSQAVSDEAGDY
ncbi:hypothetical protein B0T19DRAFT_428613 [Cercophora scortea]|uniref:GRF-type domain-containing protein n=1 Tax=Cercophora scortea TaxID=314031 RepID=A0AAE0IG96_9PEZI|nr:hypothetical protein B0T19DRAFT_428613 [Cercophora scortea]